MIVSKRFPSKTFVILLSLSLSTHYLFSAGPKPSSSRQERKGFFARTTDRIFGRRDARAESSRDRNHAEPETPKQKEKRELMEKAQRDIEQEAKKIGIKQNDWTLKNSEHAKRIVQAAENKKPEGIKNPQFSVQNNLLQQNKQIVKDEKTRLKGLQEAKKPDPAEIESQKEVLKFAKEDLDSHKTSMKKQFGDDAMKQIKSIDAQKKAAHEFKKKVDEEEKAFLATPKGKVALIAKQNQVTSVDPKKVMKDLESQDGQAKIDFINKEYENAQKSAQNAKKITKGIEKQYKEKQKEILKKYPESELAQAYQEKLKLEKRIADNEAFLSQSNRNQIDPKVILKKASIKRDKSELSQKERNIASLRKQKNPDDRELKTALKQLDRDVKTQREAASEIQNETEKNRKKIKTIMDRINSAATKVPKEETKKEIEQD